MLAIAVTLGLLVLAEFFFLLWLLENVHASRARRKRSYRKVATSARKLNFRDPRY